MYISTSSHCNLLEASSISRLPCSIHVSSVNSNLQNPGSLVGMRDDDHLSLDGRVPQQLRAWRGDLVDDFSSTLTTIRAFHR